MPTKHCAGDSLSVLIELDLVHTLRDARGGKATEGTRELQDPAYVIEGRGVRRAHVCLCVRACVHVHNNNNNNNNNNNINNVIIINNNNNNIINVIIINNNNNNINYVIIIIIIIVIIHKVVGGCACGCVNVCVRARRCGCMGV